MKTVRAAIGLGSNLSNERFDPPALLTSALVALAGLPETRLIAQSSIYRSMPLLYVAAGAGTLALFGTRSPSALSSLLLFLAAAITYQWRRKRKLLRRQRRPGSLPQHPSP